MYKYCFETPLGEMILFYKDNMLYFLNFKDQPLWQDFAKKHSLEAAPFLEDSFTIEVKDSVLAYFENGNQNFDHIGLCITGTDFQKSVYAHLLKIPANTCVTYAALAKTLGKPTAQRAVGRAIGQNPILILIPCHRVIHADSKTLGRYSGGLHRKDVFINIEKKLGK